MNLLVTGAFAWTEGELEALERLGHTVLFMRQEAEKLPCDPSWVEGAVCNGLFLHHPIEEFTALRYIQLTSAGYDRAPMDYIREKGITLHNAGGVYSIPMAEHAVWGVLELYRRGAFFRENQSWRRWEKCRDLPELSGKTVCIVGCGSVGKECAKRFRAFGCRVLGVSLSGRTVDGFDENHALPGLEGCLGVSDVTVLALPLAAESRHLLDDATLRAMKPGAVLVNIARGAIADTRAVIRALEEGHLSGAVLDVFEEEPLPVDSPLWAMENVVLTPHNSFAGEGNRERLKRVILGNLAAEE